MNSFGLIILVLLIVQMTLGEEFESLSAFSPPIHHAKLTGENIFHLKFDQMSLQNLEECAAMTLRLGGKSFDYWPLGCYINVGTTSTHFLSRSHRYDYFELKGAGGNNGFSNTGINSPSNKYQFSKKGITAYYQKAIEKVKLTGKGLHLTSKFDRLNNIFNGITNVPDKLDYHVQLNLLRSRPERESWDLWQRRLRYICTVLIDTITSLKSKGYNTDIIELGIFGSETTSSDVDIGVSYKMGTVISDDLNFLKLSLVVQTFERTILNLGFNSLQIDVEMYADYFISPENGQPFVDTSYEQIFAAIMPFVRAGMVKNMYIGTQDHKRPDRVLETFGKRTTLIEVFQTGGMTANAIRKFIKKISIANEVGEVLYLFGNDLRGKNDDVSYIAKLVDEALWRPIQEKYSTAELLTDYLSSDYEGAIRKYYHLLDLAHDEYFKLYGAQKPADETVKLTTMLELSKKISHALLFRAESYISAPTVYHVVYSLQAKASKEKQKELEDLIGTWGVMTSAMEQLGYLSRFHHQYQCYPITPINQCTIDELEAFNKKKRKYLGRLQDAVDLARSIPQRRKTF